MIRFISDIYADLKTGSSSIIKNKRVVKAVSFILPALIFLTAASAVVYYIFFSSAGEFHSDCTDTIMWAYASVRSGSVFDPDFHYAGFLPFGISLIMTPLVSVFGLSLTAHRLGMLVFFILLVVFSFMLLHEMKWSIRKIYIGVSLMLAAALSSAKLREIFWGHTIYYSLGFLFIVIGLFVYFRLLNLEAAVIRLSVHKGSRRRRLILIRYVLLSSALGIFMLLTGTDGTPILTIFALPFIGAIVSERILDKEHRLTDKGSIKIFSGTALMLLLFFIGCLILGLLTSGIHAKYQEAYSLFSPMKEWSSNALKLPASWLSLFGVKDMPNKPLFSMTGAINLLKLLSAAAAAVIPVIAVCFYSRYEKNICGRMLRIVILLHWFETALILTGFICGRLSAAPWRLSPCLMTAVLVSVLFVNAAFRNRLSVSRTAVLLALPVIAAGVISITDVFALDCDNYKKNYLFGLSSYLEDNGLDRGYASFWNANAVTVISGGRVKVRNVTIDEKGLAKQLYQTADSWYEETKGQERYFLIADDKEFTKMKNHCTELIRSAQEILEPKLNDKSFHILVFDKNLF